MQNSYPATDPVLSKVSATFAAFRRKHKGSPVRYPSNLKNLATSAVSRQRKAAEIARSAGDSDQSLSYWLKCASEGPQELKVVVERPGAVLPIAAADSMLARICMPSGTIIEIPVLALTSSLVAIFRQAEVNP